MRTRVGELDKEVERCVAILNGLPGVETFASCSGHGYSNCYVGFRCSDFESLKKIVRAVYGIRWKCGDDFDSKKHLWVVTVMPHQDGNSLVLSIDWQPDVWLYRLRRVKMREAWQELEIALGGEVE